jgi:hypothetical protein
MPTRSSILPHSFTLRQTAVTRSEKSAGEQRETVEGKEQGALHPTALRAQPNGPISKYAPYRSVLSNSALSGSPSDLTSSA